MEVANLNFTKDERVEPDAPSQSNTNVVSHQCSRREFVAGGTAVVMGTVLGGSAAVRGSEKAGPVSAGTMKLQAEGVLVSECTLPGESLADGVFAAHPNGIQVSRDRWLLLYATRGMRIGDDDRSCVYQLRRDAPDGPLIKEGMLSPAINDWDPFGDGQLCFKQHGHPVGFGVPRGALVAGRPAPHANLFVIKWRVLGLAFAPETGRVSYDADLHNRTQGVEWMQIRLNQAEDDIEIVEPIAPMRQQGYESGRTFCELEGSGWMNQTYTQAVPFKADFSEWADCNHFSNGNNAVLKYAYNASLGRYEWVETGPFLFDRPVFEASLCPWGDEWVIAGRVWDNGIAKGVGWLRTKDPFAGGGTPVYATTPGSTAPRTAYMCADGVLRLFCAAEDASPYQDNGNPLYCWDIDPDNGFAASNRQVIFDAVKAGLSADARPMVDMCKLLPPHDGSQIIIYRVKPRQGEKEKNISETLAAEDTARFGIYHSRLIYQENVASSWQFSP